MGRFGNLLGRRAQQNSCNSNVSYGNSPTCGGPSYVRNEVPSTNCHLPPRASGCVSGVSIPPAASVTGKSSSFEEKLMLSRAHPSRVELAEITSHLKLSEDGKTLTFEKKLDSNLSNFLTSQVTADGKVSRNSNHQIGADKTVKVALSDELEGIRIDIGSKTYALSREDISRIKADLKKAKDSAPAGSESSPSDHRPPTTPPVRDPLDVGPEEVHT